MLYFKRNKSTIGFRKDFINSKKDNHLFSVSLGQDTTATEFLLSASAIHRQFIHDRENTVESMAHLSEE